MVPLDVARAVRNREAGYRGLDLSFFGRDFEPRRFVRSEISATAHLFSAGLGASTLIVGFAGTKFRLFGPIWQILQIIDDREFDFLLLADERRRHFESGVPGFGNSMRNIAAAVAALASKRGYRKMITYGTSMGGFPALRAGSLIGADRAISIGGRYAWDIRRMQDGGDTIVAFDPLCACRTPGAGESIAIFSEGNAEDASNDARMRTVLPQLRSIAVPGHKHNALHAATQRGNACRLYEILFNLDEQPATADLVALCTA
ncbi:hypothetical protein [Oricola sp.]|uniref:hypothetical protein n=1 Tax=Oricola sp. TaxID=1979950 RepID=UPI003BA9334D